MKRVIGVLWLSLGWLIVFCGAASAAPPPPDGVAQATSYLREDLPPDLALHRVTVEDERIDVCLVLDIDQLKADNGLGVEWVEEAVRYALTPVTWHELFVQAVDDAGQCRPLSDFLPEVTNPAAFASEVAVSSFSHVEEARSLAGKTIYISAGHGWQWGKDYSTASPAIWRTQRIEYEGIIEDHNNAEAVDQYLIPYLEQAGATVIPVRERDWNTTRVLVDNDAGPSVYTEQGAWATSVVSGYAGGTYRVVPTVDGTPTATATWVLTVPASGTYALYAWVRSLSDRAPDAHYCVHHAGGPSDVYVDQRVRPETWRYLGTFPAYAGPLVVTLDNTSALSEATVVADALRLGSGMFDDVQGIETRAPYAPNKPWWESDAEYYSQWMGLDPGDWSYFNDVVARPMYARWNQVGSADAAIYVSWHSNGYNGTARGTESYVHNGVTYPRTDGSFELQEAVHNELIHDIRLGWDAEWTDRGRKAANLGEVRMLWDDDPTARMPGVLLEVAFHDHPEDAEALKDPRFNQLAARAVYQGIVHYFEQQDAVDLVELPEPPTHVRVQNRGEGKLRVAWASSPTDTLGVLGDAADYYHVYTSPDGLAWYAPLVAEGTVYTLSHLSPGQTVYVRVTGVNAGGESFPTEVLGARVSAPTGAPVLLIVNAFDKLTHYGLYEEADPLMGINQRMWLERMNSRDYVVHHGEAVPIPYAWDSASNEAVIHAGVDLQSYVMVDWILGEESTEIDGTFSPSERLALESFLLHGGALLVSGSEFAWDLGAQGRDPTFLNQVLYTEYVADDAETYAVTPVVGGAFEGLATFSFDAPGEYDADYPDVLAPYGGSGASPALSYAGGLGGTAAVQYAAGCRRLLVLGFPLEVVIPAARPDVMAAALDFLDTCVPFVDTVITQPQAGTYYTLTPEFTGAATGGALTHVEVQIARRQDQLFWNGTAWLEDSVWLQATGVLSWSYALPPLVDGIYDLHARAVAAQPDLSPAETYFMFDVTPPLSPTLVAPVSGAVVTGTQVVFQWEGAADTSPVRYEVQLDARIYAVTGTIHSVEVSAPGETLAEGPHQWRVRAIDAAGNVGPWSAVESFNVMRFSTAAIVSPQAWTYYSRTPPLTGTAAGIDLQGVEVQLQRDADGTFWDGVGWGSVPHWLTASVTLTSSSVLTWTYASVPDLPGEGWYTVRARPVGVLPSPTHAEAPFFYDAMPPLTPEPLAPQGSLMLEIFTLRWRAPEDTGSPLTYHLELDGEILRVASTFYTVTLASGAHQWRVRAVDAAGNASPWSVWMHFEIFKPHVYLPLVMRNHSHASEMQCSLLLDSGFETEGNWTYNALALRVEDNVHTGTYAARVGIPPDMPGQTSYSSIAHRLMIPEEATSVTLRFWAYPIAEESEDDAQYVILRDMENEAYVLYLGSTDARAWQSYTYDLSIHTGQNVTLFFGARNDDDDATASLYIDDVQVEVCH